MYLPLENVLFFRKQRPVGCTKEFYKQGFLEDNSRTYAEYQHRCGNCPYFKHNIGSYYGDEKHTDNLGEKDFFIVVKNTNPLDNAVKLLQKRTKALWLSSMGPIDYSAIAGLPEPETACIGISKCAALWDMSKNPNFQVSELNTGIEIPDLPALKTSAPLRYLV